MKSSASYSLSEAIDLMTKITEDANVKIIEFRARYGLDESECRFLTRPDGLIGIALNVDKLRS